MEVWGMILVALSVIAAGAAAIFAWVQAHAAVETLKDARVARDEAKASAVESARLAGEANEAFRRQAAAQEEANRIKRQEMTPPDWSPPTKSRGDLLKVTNTSGGVLLVKEFEVQPDAAERLVTVRTNHPDGRYEYGDSFEFAVLRPMGIQAEKLTVWYHHEDDPDEDLIRLHIGL